MRGILGPPWRIDQFARMQREAWTYNAMGMNPQQYIVQFSSDGIVRERFRSMTRTLCAAGDVRPSRAGLAALLLALSGCAGYDGRGLVPGQSTSAEVDKLMGPARDKRAGPNGETVLWYPRLPAGRVSYAARIGKRRQADRHRAAPDGSERRQAAARRLARQRRARPARAAIPRRGVHAPRARYLELSGGRHHAEADPRATVEGRRGARDLLHRRPQVGAPDGPE